MGFLKYFRAADAVAVGYTLIVMVLIVLARERLDSWGVFFAIHGLAAAAVAGLAVWHARRPDRTRVEFMRYWYLMLLVPVFFIQLNWILPAVNPRNFDPVLADMDLALGTPAMFRVMESLSHPVLTEFFKVCWTLYFPFFLLIAIPLYFRHDREKFEEMRLTLALGWLVSYLGYFLVPAHGVDHFLSQIHVKPAGDGLLLANALREHIARMEGGIQDVYPSGHTIIAILVIVLAFRYRLRTRWVCAVLGGGIVISTIYLRYHYGVDVLAGILVAGAIVWLVRCVYKLGPGEVDWKELER